MRVTSLLDPWARLTELHASCDRIRESGRDDFRVGFVLALGSILGRDMGMDNWVGLEQDWTGLEWHYIRSACVCMIVRFDGLRGLRCFK